MTFAGWERMDFDLLRIPAAPWLLLAAVLCSLAYLIYKHRWNQTSVPRRPIPAPDKDGSGDKRMGEKTTYDPVEPLPDFEWQSTEPVKHRPFKPKYHLTMAIQNSSVSELLQVDQEYLNRITLRKQLISEHRYEVVAALSGSKPAIDEFYTWMTGTYLPTRFPRMFQITTNPESQQRELFNAATNEFFSLTPSEDEESTLVVLGGLVEDDILFLLPSSDNDGYTLRAYVGCFPNGFRTRDKLGMKLRDIHIPVPGYKAKLEKSMDRWFDRLEVGTFAKRFNWSITTHDRLFAIAGNHLYEGQTAKSIDVDVDKARVRSERQVVHRLPQSRAVLFSVKTYLYPLQDIKDEGLGEALADAIDGMALGNAPGIFQYKRASEWGASVQKFLRS